MNRYKNLLTLVSVIVALQGCEMMNSNYDCPLSEGASCMSLHDMDALVTRGIYPKEPNTSNLHQDNALVASNAMPEVSGYPLRTKDKIAKIWIAPYMDNNGNYHEQSTLYTVVENSSWDLKLSNSSKAMG